MRRLRKTVTLALSAGALFATVPVAWAGPIDPTSLPSIGTLSISWGLYSFDTNTDTLAGTNDVRFTGETYNGIAVFDLSQIDISGGTFKVIGSAPIAILSRGNFVFTGGSINLSGGNGTSDAPGVGVAGGGDGGGLTGAGPGGGHETGGGGFGGVGGGAHSSYGATYGNLATQLVGGSGGGWDADSILNGGAGGGAIEVGATGSITINGGSILAAGGNGDVAGGGSGGGIFLHAESVIFRGIDALAVNGGNGGASAFGGGGGRILVETDSYTSSGADVFNLAPGSQPIDAILPGAGVLTLDIQSVPEQSSIVVLATAIPIAAAYLWRRRRRVGAAVCPA
jgi:hypothetical protein